MLTVESLTFQYRGATSPAVEEISFEIPHGHIFGFLGPSGAGKSTVQKILTRLLPLQHGTVCYDRRPLAALGREFFAEVGVSFEHPNLFPRLTGRENLLAFAGLYGDAIDDPAATADALLEQVGLGPARDRKAEAYSKGMKQRLVFARSIMHKPRFLFLDEPTSGLDPATARVIMDIIRAQRERGAAVFLTTHDMLVAETLCDQIGFLHDGRIAALDSPRALKLTHGERSVRVEHRGDAQASAASADPTTDSGLRRETLFLDNQDHKARLEALIAAGHIETMHSQEATLDHIFVKLTGAELAS